MSREHWLAPLGQARINDCDYEQDDDTLHDGCDA